MNKYLKSLLKYFFLPIYKRIELRNLETKERSIIINAKNLINNRNHISTKINDFEFSAFSQWGEDGIISYLVENLEIVSNSFIEFGVENYLESNTRFLLINNNWSGLIFDMSKENISEIKKHYYYWRHDLRAETATITAENINDLIEKNGFKKPIGLLSIDIDGNDYWVWDSINVINPRIVICEYNSLWGAEHAVSTPYNPTFMRSNSHFSNLYYGASIKAFTELAKTKGYSLIGSNRAGNNIFFVRDDLVSNLNIIDPEKAWVQSQFSEARDEDGKLSFLSFKDRLNQVSDQTLVNLNDGKEYIIRDIYDL